MARQGPLARPAIGVGFQDPPATAPLFRVTGALGGLCRHQLNRALIPPGAAAVVLAPDTTTAIGGFLLHIDLSGLTRSLTWANFVGGLLGWG